MVLVWLCALCAVVQCAEEVTLNTDFRILGNLDIIVSGRRLVLKAAKQKTLMALFLGHPDQTLSVDVLIDELWGSMPPPSARNTLYSLMSRLRGRLSAAADTESHLIHDSAGYRLQVDPARIDAHRFLTLTGEAHRQALADARHEALRCLKRALHMWRGTPLDDVTLTPRLTVLRKRLQEERLNAYERYVGLMLPSDVTADVVDELRALLAEHPFRETLWELLMVSLARLGRRGEALAAYQQARSVLIRELGVEPGPGLRKVQQEILTDEPATGSGTPPHPDPQPSMPPRQLPRDLVSFVGRDRERAELSRLLVPSPANAAPVVVISGVAGSGKSALAVKAAHAAADAYPDGQLYIDLCAATPGVMPLPPATALGSLLRALGVPGERIPLDGEEAAALFRTLTSRRSLLVVLDNAHDAAQVRPLLPSGSDSAVIVTSRTNLAHLPDAISLLLPPLQPPEAAHLLRRAAGDATDQATIDALAELCGYLPLALQVIAARLAGQPHLTAAQLLARLEDEGNRLRELTVGDVEVRRSLSVSHDALTAGGPEDRQAALALGLLARLQIPEVELRAAAALFGQSLTDATRILDKLVERHLLTATAHGRWGMHDLIRLFAREKVLRENAGQHWYDGFHALLEFYIATSQRAFTLVDPHRERYPAPPTAVAPAPLADARQATDWLQAECMNAIAIAVQALSEPDRLGHAGMALARNLHWSVDREGHAITDAKRMHQLALEAARHLGDQQSEMYALDHLGGTLSRLGQHGDACDLLQRELALSRRLDDERGELRALGNLSAALIQARRPAQALPSAGRQLHLAERVGWRAAQTYAHLMLGAAHYELRHLRDAEEHLTAAMLQARANSDAYQEAVAMDYLAQIHLCRGEAGRALAMLEGALDLAREAGDRRQEAGALVTLARAHYTAGDVPVARNLLTEAMTSCKSFLPQDEMLHDYYAAAYAEIFD
ncbi:BTAD domain-containing putative transcriptional regulator [Nonomuraea wenchangensis]